MTSAAGRLLGNNRSRKRVSPGRLRPASPPETPTSRTSSEMNLLRCPRGNKKNVTSLTSGIKDHVHHHIIVGLCNAVTFLSVQRKWRRFPGLQASKTRYMGRRLVWQYNIRTTFSCLHTVAWKRTQSTNSLASGWLVPSVWCYINNRRTESV